MQSGSMMQSGALMQLDAMIQSGAMMQSDAMMSGNNSGANSSGQMVHGMPTGHHQASEMTRYNIAANTMRLQQMHQHQNQRHNNLGL